MNRNVIIGLVIGAVLLLGGVGYYVYSSSNDESSETSTFSSEEITNFLNPYDQPVTMTLTTSDSANPSSDGTITMQFQDDDTWSMSMETDEGNTQIVYDGDYSYMQNPEDGTWLRLPAGDEVDSPAGDFKISDEDMEDFRTNAVSVGQSDCSLGTCDTFEYTDPVTGELATLKVGSGGRIAEVVAVTGTSTVTMVFDYDTSVNVQVPAKYEEFDIPQ